MNSRISLFKAQEIVSIYQKFEGCKPDHNILYPFIYLELWLYKTWRPGEPEVVK
jgi:hypothetical protein